MSLDAFLLFAKVTYPILHLLVYVGLFVLVPWLMGLLVRMVLWRRASRLAWLQNCGGLLTLMGWGLAFFLGKKGIMAYEASILFGALLFVPGLFMWGLGNRFFSPADSRTKRNKDELVIGG